MKKSSPETTRPRGLIFGMLLYLVDLYQICSNYAPGVKTGLPKVSTGTWSAISRYVSFKQKSGERYRATCFKGCWVVFFIFIQIVYGSSLSKK